MSVVRQRSRGRRPVLRLCLQKCADRQNQPLRQGEFRGPWPSRRIGKEFEIEGKKFTALSGGPHFKFSEAISFQIPCATQDEIDYYWTDYPPKARSSNAADLRISSACPGKYSRLPYRICSVIVG